MAGDFALEIGSSSFVFQMRLFFKMMSYTPAVWLARWGITKTFDVTRFMFKFASEITPLIDYITDR